MVAHLDPGDTDAAAAGRGAAAGTDLVRILADRDKAVAASVRERFPGTTTMRSRARIEAAGWYSGRAAGDRASLGSPSEIRGAS